MNEQNNRTGNGVAGRRFVERVPVVVSLDILANSTEHISKKTGSVSQVAPVFVREWGKPVNRCYFESEVKQGQKLSMTVNVDLPEVLFARPAGK